MLRVRIIMLMAISLIGYAGTLTTYAEGRLFRAVPTADDMETTGFTVYDIKRTDDGFIWLATDRGLLRYDGEHTVRIPLPDGKTTALQVYSLAPAPEGALIAATNQGIYRLTLAGDRYRATLLLDGNVLNATCGLKSDSGFSLIGSDEGLLVLMPDGKTKRITVGRDVLDPSNNIVDMVEGEDGLFLLTKGGVWRMNPRDLSVVCVSDDEQLGHLGISSIGISGGKVYIGTRGNGIWRMNKDGEDLREVFDFSKGNVVTSLETSADGGYMYVGTDGGGVAKIELPSERIVEYARHSTTDPVSPRSNQVYSLLADEGGRLWIGYYQNGADYTPSWTGPFELIDNPAVFNTRDVPVRALSLAGDRITIGTREGITVFERNCSTAWTVRSPQLRSEMVISLLDHGGETYIGTYGGGVQILNPVTKQLRDMPYEGPDAVFRSGHIFAMATDRSGNVWLGTNEGLFLHAADGTRKHFTSANSRLPEGNVYGIFFDSEGKGWICTEKGLCVYDPRQKRIRTDLFPSNFPHTARYRSVYEDSHKRLYFVPETGMVISSNPDLSEIISFAHPLLVGADAKGVVEDSTGDIWIATNRGIFRVDSNGDVVRFGLASGLPSPSFLQGQPFSDSDGHIWFGNSAGLLRLTESEIDSSIEAQRALVPTVLKVNGKPLDFVPHRKDSDGSYHIDLDKSSNTVKIEFSTFSFALEEPEAYVYSLDGGEWKRFTGELSITLYELSPGKHEVRVKSANDSDLHSDMTSVRLHIPYPVWWYVMIALVIALVLIPALLWLYVARKNIAKKIELAEIPVVTDEVGSTIASEEPSPRQKYASNTLTRNDAREIARKVEEIMETKKPYLNTDLKVADLAALVGISSHKLSQFFSQHKGQTFYDYVNRYRVREFKRLVKEDMTKSLTLSAMAEKAGFSSRASFFRYFKNTEGISPGEYIKTSGGK